MLRSAQHDINVVFRHFLRVRKNIIFLLGMQFDLLGKSCIPFAGNCEQTKMREVINLQALRRSVTVALLANMAVESRTEISQTLPAGSRTRLSSIRATPARA